MSVAQELAVLRQKERLVLQRPSATARSDLAASARNALNLLQTVDNQIGGLARPLLLLSVNKDRLTLPPEQERELRKAVILLTQSLSPIFTIRRVQAIFEWLLTGLSLPTHGSDEEYDQLIIASLPFCETPKFVDLLIRMAPLRPRWQFLSPVVKQKKPASIPFLAKTIPTRVMKLLLKTALSYSSRRIPTTPIASLIASLGVRRLLLTPDFSPLFLSITAALEKLTRRAGKDSFEPKAFPKDLASALISSLAVALSNPAVDYEMLQAASIACANVLLKCRIEELNYASVSCLVLATYNSRHCIPIQTARDLLRSPALKHAISSLHTSDASALYGTLILNSIGNDPADLQWSVLSEALSKFTYVSDQVVKPLLSNLFDLLISDVSWSEIKRKETLEGFTSVLTPLAHGRFANAVDLALKDHFKRRKVKKAKTRYLLLDAVFAQSLHGTQFAPINFQEGVDMSNLTMMVALDHPESEVRRATLLQVREKEDLRGKPGTEGRISMWNKFLSMMRYEEKLRNVTAACDCALLFAELVEPKTMLIILANRYQAEYGKKTKKEKKNKKRKPDDLKALFMQILAVCKLYPINEFGLDHALLTGLMLSNLIPESLSKDDKEKLEYLFTRNSPSDGFRQFFVESKEIDIFQRHQAALKRMVYSSLECMGHLLGNISSWNSSWGMKVLGIWFQVMKESSLNSRRNIHPGNVLRVAGKLFNEYTLVRHDLINLVVKYCGAFYKVSPTSISKLTMTGDLWSIVGKAGNEDQCRAMLRFVVTESGLKHCLSILKDRVLGMKGHSILRANSLQWYVSICISHPKEDVRKEAIQVLVRTAFGSNQEMQEYSLTLCKRKRPEEGSKKRERRTELRSFLELASELPSGYVWDPRSGKLENAISMDLQTKIISPIRSPSPLLFSTNSNEGTVNLVKKLILQPALNRQQKLFELQPYLRALHGVCIDDPEDRRNLLAVLLEHLPALISMTEEDKKNALENAARITQLLIATPIGDTEKSASLESIANFVVAQVQKLQQYRKSSDEQDAKVISVFLGISAILVKAMEEINEFKELRLSLLGGLFAFSTLSSSSGMISRKYVDILALDGIAAEDVIVVLTSAQQTLAPSPKRARGAQQGFIRTCREILREVIRGVLEGLLRWTSSKDPGVFPLLQKSVDVRRNLFSAMKSFVEFKNGDCPSLAGLEYDLSLLLQSAASLYRMETSPLERNGAVDMQLLSKCALYPGASSTGEETASVRSVRSSAVVLLEVMAPLYAGQTRAILAPVVQNLLLPGNIKSCLPSLRSFIPALLKSDCKFEEISSWICKAAYVAESVISTEGNLHIVASCCRMTSDVQEAVQICLRHIERQLNSLSNYVVARECVNLLLEVHLSPIEDLRAICALSETLRCMLVCCMFQEPRFLSKVFHFTRHMSSLEESTLSGSVCDLYLGLLFCDDEEVRRNSITTLINWLPITVFNNCVSAGLLSKNKEVRSRTMDIVLTRFNSINVPFMWKWESDDEEPVQSKEVRDIKSQVLKEVGSILCDILCQISASNEFTNDLLLAGYALEKLVLALGSSSHETTVVFAERILQVLNGGKLSEALSNPEEKKRECVWIGSTLSVLSSFVRSLGKHSIPFVPIVLNSAMKILESTFIPDSVLAKSKSGIEIMTALTEAAVKFFTSVLDSCPSFLGTRTFRGLVTLNLRSNVEVIGDLVRLAMEKTPANMKVATVCSCAGSVQESGAEFGAICSVVQSVEIGVDVMHKAEVKMYSDRLVQALLSFAEYNRDGYSLEDTVEVGSGSESDSEEENREMNAAERILERYVKVDESCAMALGSIILKVSETEFRKIFSFLVQWCEGGRMSAEAVAVCERNNVRVIPNITRATPFYRMVLHVFGKLQTIMVPYIFELVDKLLEYVSKKACKFERKNRHAVGKGMEGNKRKRAESDAENEGTLCCVFVESEKSLTECCVDILNLLLKQNAGSHQFSAALVTKVQNGLLSAFDNSEGQSEKVREGLSWLGTRIVGMGKASESREESRGLLNNLSRNVLLRTQERTAGMRGGALKVACAMAQSVGDEYLVTLAESMPILAEVIDDEEPLVRKEAKRLVAVLERLAGEPIMDQLK